MDRLNADVIGAGFEMRPQAASDRCGVTPEHHRIDELVGTAIGKIGFCEADAQPVVAVVGHSHIAMQLMPAESASRSGVRLEANLLLDGQELVGPQSGSR